MELDRVRVSVRVGVRVWELRNTGVRVSVRVGVRVLDVCSVGGLP